MTTRLGFFDSGIGGLTVLKRVLQRHGEVSCIYLGDNARVPYGTKDQKEIRLIAKEVVEWFRDQNLSAVVMACNTTNSLALDVVEAYAGVPVFSLIRAASEMIFEKRIGILATPATAASGEYSNQIKSIHAGTIVIEQGCPDFVPMIEDGIPNINQFRRSAEIYLSPLLKAKVQAVVFGCTHYPFAEPILRQLLPQNVRLIDPAIALAEQLDEVLGAPSSTYAFPISLASTRICVTSDANGFADKSTPWLGVRPEVELISLQDKTCFS